MIYKMRIRRRRREPDKILTIPIADSPGSVIGHREAVLRGLLPGFFISPEEVSRAIGQDSVALALRAGDGRPRTERHEELRRAYGPYVNEVLGIGGAECRELGIVIASTEVIQGATIRVCTRTVALLVLLPILIVALLMLQGLSD